MAKTESTFLNMVLTLFVVSLVSSVGVGSIYEMTKGPIAQAALAKKINAIKDVVPEFDNSPVDNQYTFETADGPLAVYPAKKDGTIVGMAVETFSNQGFGGRIKLMVGLLPDGTIKDVAVIDHKETPGLGDKMDPSKSDFSRQFAGKDPKTFKLRVKKDGGDVDAITAATISSRAFCDAVRRAYMVYKQGK